ncbi:MAG: TIGR01777 family oxidoreductase [Cytophagales bacterium]
MSQKVLITGGSGFIGQKLSALLLKKGFEVAWLSRNAGEKSNIKIYAWDLKKQHIDEKAFENVAYIVHLAGAGIADERWTDVRKKELIDSRIESTKLLLTYVQKLKIKPKAFVSSSAIGYYGGDAGNTVHDDFSNAGHDFLAAVCIKWEAEAQLFTNNAIRTVCVRTGIVLDRKNGALPKLALPINWGVGTYLGDGNQWMSWIHWADLCEIYAKAIEDEHFSGAYNAVAPNPATNKIFSETLAKQLNRWILPLYAPGFLFKIIFGEMGVVVTGSSHVLCKRLSETDFHFKFRTLEEALKDIYN